MKRHKGTTGRDYIGVSEDKFVVGMNAANKGVSPNRKAFGENILAFSIFAQQHDDVVLYLHTDQLGALGGIKLMQLLQSCGVPEEKFKFVDPYVYRTGIDQQTLATIYTAMDVLLATSYGEGFGIPTVEAQACGTPVITSNLSSLPEVTGDAAILINPYSIDEMREAMQQIAKNNQLRLNLKSLSHRRAELFSWEKTGQETATILQSFL
jgi:glycosyltransferase involved in cell wall biosynthesis